MASYKIMGLVFVRIWEKQNQFLLIKLVDNRICWEVVKMILVYVGGMWVGVLGDFGKENHLWKLVIIQKFVWIFAIFFGQNVLIPSDQNLSIPLDQNLLKQYT